MTRVELDPNEWQHLACAAAGRNLTRSEWHQYLNGQTYRKTCPRWQTGI